MKITRIAIHQTDLPYAGDVPGLGVEPDFDNLGAPLMVIQ